MNVGYVAHQQQGEQSALRFTSAGERTGPSRLARLLAKHLSLSRLLCPCWPSKYPPLAPNFSRNLIHPERV